jgi:thiamine pyrophosphokinase
VSRVFFLALALSCAGLTALLALTFYALRLDAPIFCSLTLYTWSLMSGLSLLLWTFFHYSRSSPADVPSIQLPHAIVGDLDSLHSESRSYFAQRAVPIHQHVDTESTDFGKGLEFLRSNLSRRSHGAGESADKTRDNSIDKPADSSPADSSLLDIDVVVFGGLGGRADHAFGTLNDLYQASDAGFAGSSSAGSRKGNIYLLTAESLIFVLEPGLNIIATPVSVTALGENIGIVPLGAPAVIATKGLQWDVEDYHTAFGGKVSTSNHIRHDTVEVSTDQRVLCCLELGADLGLKPNLTP